MKFNVFLLALGLTLWTGAAQSQELTPVRVIGESGNICESEKFKITIDAIQCVAKNCPQLNDEKKKIYEDRCTTGPRVIRERGAFKTADGYYVDSDRLPVFDRDGTTEGSGSEEPKLLSPCECLAKLKERFATCEIELCKPEEPRQPTVPETPKETVPEAPKEANGPKQFFFEGAGCSLSSASGLDGFAGWALLLLTPLATRIRRKK